MNGPPPLFQGRRSRASWAYGDHSTARSGPVWDLTMGIGRASSVDGLRRFELLLCRNAHGGVSPCAATLGRSINRNFGLRRRTAFLQNAIKYLRTYTCLRANVSRRNVTSWIAFPTFQKKRRYGERDELYIKYFPIYLVSKNAVLFLCRVYSDKCGTLKTYFSIARKGSRFS